MKKAIIFDLDGTLWDTTQEVLDVWSKVACEYGMKFNKKEIKEIMGLTSEEIVKKLFSNIEDGNKFIEKCQKGENEYLKNNGGHIYINTISTIKTLYDKYNLYIVSNCQSGYIEVFLRYYNLEKYFKDYECSGNTRMDKKYNIKLVLQRNNIKDAIYVGDTQKDYQASISNGLKFIWASYGFGKCENYYRCINDICELLEI